MKILIVAAMAAFLVGATYPDRPPFEFRGITAGQEVSPKSLKRCGKRGDIVTCENLFDKIAGVDAMIITTYYQRRLVDVAVSIDRNHVSELSHALDQKYGAPCRTDRSKWKNAMGAELDNNSSTWCFSAGELTLYEIGHRMDKSDLIYIDNNQPPEHPATVDF